MFSWIVSGAVVALTFDAQPAAPIVVIAPDAERAAEDSRVICKSQKSTGTRFEKKSCRTVKQWADMREQHMRDMKEAIGPGIQSASDNPGVPN